MNLEKAVKRDKEIRNRKHGEVKDSRSVFTIRDEEIKRAEKIRRLRRLKEALEELDITDEI